MTRLDRTIRTLVAVLALAAGPARATETPATPPDPAEQLRRELQRFFTGAAAASPTVLGGLTETPEARQEILDDLSARSAEELAALADGFAAVPAWQAVPEALASALPRESLAALTSYAEHAENEARELESFRDELATLYAAARLLPAGAQARLAAGNGGLASQHEALAGLDLGALRQLRTATATQDELGAIGEQLVARLSPTTRRHLPALAAHGAFDDADLQALDGFRADLDTAIATVDGLPPGLRGRLGATLEGVRGRLAAATPEQLFVLREELDPAALRSAVETVALLAGAAPSAERSRQLEAWRAATVGFYRDLAATDPSGLAEAAAEAVETASTRQLVLLEAALATPPTDAPTLHALPIAIVALPDEQIDQVLVNLNCVINPGSITILGVTVSLPSIDLNWICTPLETAINAVESAIDTVADTVDDVVNTVTSLPGQLIALLESFFSGLAADVLAVFSPENMQQALGLDGDFWNDLPQLPQIPCPPHGTEIPFFGLVGDDATAATYDRYLWVFDKVLELIPDTEISLSIKIPAQVLYAGVQYVGVCLDAAAEEVAGAATDAFRADVVAGLDGAESALSQITGQVGTLGFELAEQLDGLGGLQTALAIEAALSQGGAIVGPSRGGVRFASFQLPAAVGGAIELVRGVVADVIGRTLGAGEDVHCAPDELERGDDAYAIGEYKTAFDAFRRAYQEAARGGPDGCPAPAPGAAIEPH